MINFYKVRKNAVLVMWPTLGTVFFYGGLLTYGFVGGLCSMGAFILLGFFLGKLLLHNNFSAALEGGGLLVVDLSSKGVLPTFLVQMDGRNLTKNGKIKTHFNRSIVQYMRPPVRPVGVRWWQFWKYENVPVAQPVTTEPQEEVVTSTRVVQDSKGGYKLTITADDYQKSRMLVETLPVIFCNMQTGQFLTKDFLSDFEMKSTILHALVDMYHKIERLEHHMLDFGRYVVQAAMGDGQKWWQSKVLWIILLVVGLGALAYYVGPGIIGAIKGGVAPAQQAFAQAGQSVQGSGLSVVN